jgi:hypothetical protein
VVDLNIALAEEAFAADMHVVAVDAPLDTKAGPGRVSSQGGGCTSSSRTFSRSASATGVSRFPFPRDVTRAIRLRMLVKTEGGREAPTARCERSQRHRLSAISSS